MRLKTLLLAVVVATAPCRIALASNITGIVVFGDSLSDPGNASIGTLGADPGPGYATRSVTGVPFPVGYYTNPQSGSGPSGLWIDQLAAKFGITDPSPFLASLGGTNYAVASSFTAGFNGPAPGMDAQVLDYLTSVGGVASSTDLYTFWGGANDIFDGLNPITAANNIEAEIEAVAADGGKDFLWPDLAPLGETPGILAEGPLASAAANFFTAEFDAQCATDVSQLDALGLDVTGVDVDSLFNNITADPGAYDLTNVTGACDLTAGCDPNTYLYWDAEHPTTEADSLVANLAFADLTPEPPSATLLVLGLLGLPAIRYSRRRQIAA